MNDKNDGIIKPGLRLCEHNATFHVFDRSETPGKWHVQCSVPGGLGFLRTKPKIIEMTEERLLEIYNAKIGSNAMGNMRTIGARVGERVRLRGQTGKQKRPIGRRFKWNFSPSGRVVAVPC
jgi:hypothetical protein